MTEATITGTKQQFIAILERELSKYEWTKNPERFARARDAIANTVNGQRTCALSESWALAWKEIGMKGKPTYKGIHALPEGEEV